MIVVDAVSGGIEAFPTNERTTITVKKFLSAVFAGFAKPKTIISAKGTELVSVDFKTWCKTQRIYKMENTLFQAEQKQGSRACNFRHSTWNQHFVDPTQSIRTDCSRKRQLDCEMQSRDQYHSQEINFFLQLQTINLNRSETYPNDLQDI